MLARTMHPSRRSHAAKTRCRLSQQGAASSGDFSSSTRSGHSSARDRSGEKNVGLLVAGDRRQSQARSSDWLAAKKQTSMMMMVTMAAYFPVAVTVAPVIAAMAHAVAAPVMTVLDGLHCPADLIDKAACRTGKRCGLGRNGEQSECQCSTEYGEHFVACHCSLLEVDPLRLRRRQLVSAVTSMIRDPA
jgi:hypothetical protein